MKNVAQSVRQRLLNIAKTKKDTFDLILTHYGLERLLYRISQSEWKERVFLKGALLFSVWHNLPYRPTNDLDLLGEGFTSMDDVNRMFITLCQMKVTDDGLRFLPDSIRCIEIREGNIYHGVRVRLNALLAGARIPLQVDIGFGDSITPKPEYIVYPAMLEFPAPVVYAYTKYSVVAEKFQAMAVLGMANSRMKDFYDIWIMHQKFAFSGSILCQSIQSTFQRRRSKLPRGMPMAFTEVFFNDPTKKVQWKAFLSKKNIEVENKELADIVPSISRFLMPPLMALHQNKAFDLTWKPSGPWQSG